MPDPADYDNEGDWMEACVPAVLADGAAENQDQAVAMCLDMWRNRDKRLSAMINQRAYSVLTIKAVDEDRREIEGIATTPSTDRIGDIVEPLGARFSLPVPLIWQHNHDEPVGHVTYAKAKPDGIPFKAKLVKETEPGLLKDLLDKAWQSIKHGLVRGVSIGFRAKEYAFLDEGGGIRFIEWDWLELSLVTIPANVEATITTIKRCDSDPEAALGHRGSVPLRKQQPGASGRSNPKPVRLRDMTDNRKSFADQIAQLENARAAKDARQGEIMQAAANEGRSTDEAEQDEFDTLDAEIKKIDGDLRRLKSLEERNKQRATPVDGGSQQAGSDSRGGVVPQIRVGPPQLPPGIPFARYAKCVGLAKGNLMHAQAIAAGQYSQDPRIENALKAAVAAGTTDPASWAGALVGEESQIFADFVEYLRPRTIIGRFGNDGIPALRQVPFRVPLITQTGAGDGYWVGEANAKPMTSFNFSRTTLEPLKAANIAVVTEEVLRSSSPAAETILRDQLAAALRQRLDTDFISPTKAAVSGVSPASITNGLVPIASAGNDADSIRTDAAALINAFLDSDNMLESGVWIMSMRTATRLGLLTNAWGQPEFPGVTMRGGNLSGMPVITSEFVAATTGGSPETTTDNVYLVNANDIYLGDDGAVSVDMSREASLEMATDPTMSSATGSPLAPAAATAAYVSMFQTNSVAFRAERTINWAKRRSTAVVALSGVAWGVPTAG